MLVLMLDQFSKQLVLSSDRFSALQCRTLNAPCGSVDLVPGLDLSFVWNRGVSFGALQAGGAGIWPLLLASVVGGLFAFWLIKAKRWIQAAALSAILGGALGNMIDRARFGAVADFIDMTALGVPWVFNLADLGVCIGAIVLALDQLVADSRSSR